MIESVFRPLALRMPAVTATPPDRSAADALAAAFVRASSRLSPPPTPWRSVAIHAAVLLLWIGLFSLAFSRGGLLAWSVGGVYIAYDTLLLGFVAANTRRLLRIAPAAAAPPPTRVSVGVVLAAHNEAVSLPATIEALLAQTEPPDEIVIADDGSTDATPAVLAARFGLVAPAVGAVSVAGERCPTLRWHRLPRGGKARALNAALVHLTSTVILTVDADTLLDRRAVAAVRHAFAVEPELVAVTGVITPVCKPNPMGRCLEWFQTYEYIRNFLSRYAWMQVDSLLLISGAFAGFRLSAVIEAGGFDPSCLVEDYELIHRLRRYGVEHGLDRRFRVLGDAQARTEAPGSVGAFLSQRRRWFGGFLQTQYWYRAMVGNRRYGWLGTLMLPVKAIDTLQPLYGLTAFGLLLFYGFDRRLDALAPVSLLIGAKILLDLGFHLWSVHLYRRWVGDARRASFGWALVAALAEPFSFQILRHLGAAWGWVLFLGGRKDWGRQARFGIARADDAL